MGVVSGGLGLATNHVRFYHTQGVGRVQLGGANHTINTHTEDEDYALHVDVGGLSRVGGKLLTSATYLQIIRNYAGLSGYLKFWIKKVGAPAGKYYIRIRRISDDYILFEKDMGLAALLDVNYAELGIDTGTFDRLDGFTTSDTGAVMTDVPIIYDECYILIEYAGAGSSAADCVVVSFKTAGTGDGDNSLVKMNLLGVYSEENTKELNCNSYTGEYWNP